jgi:hypothetical protein
MSKPIEKINQKEILLARESLAEIERDFAYYNLRLQKVEIKKRAVEQLLERLTEGLTKDQKEDLI